MLAQSVTQRYKLEGFSAPRHQVLAPATALKSLAGLGTPHCCVIADSRYRSSIAIARLLKLKIVCRRTDLCLKTEENIATPTLRPWPCNQFALLTFPRRYRQF